MINALPHVLPARPQSLHPFGICGFIAAIIDRRRRTLEHIEMLRITPEERNALDCRCTRTDEGDILVFCCEQRRVQRQVELEARGVEVVPTALTDGKLELSAVLRELGRRDISSVIVEAGPRLNFEALRSRCVDKVLCFVAPKILGGQSPLPLAGGEGFAGLDHSLRLRFAAVERTGDDLLLEAYVAGAKDTH